MANKITNYLGKLIGWNQTTVNILGRDVVGIEEFEYSPSPNPLYDIPRLHFLWQRLELIDKKKL